MRKIKRFLLSRKTVFSLICAVGISCLIGSTIPQVTGNPPEFVETWKAQSPKIYYVVDLLQLNRVYSSVWFLVLVGLIACSLTYSIYYQSKVLIRSRGSLQKEISQGSFKNFCAFKLAPSSGFRFDELVHDIKGILKASGYRPFMVAEGGDYFIFGKNRWGRWGGVIFHVGLLFMVVAGLYTLAFQKKGIIHLVPSKTFQGNDEDWGLKRLGVFARRFDLGFPVRVERFIPTYWENDQVKDLQTTVTLTDEKGEIREFSVSPGNPIHFMGTRIYQSVRYGYALGFILKKEDAEVRPAGFFLRAPGKKDQPFAGKMDFPDTDYTLDIKFYPNLIEPSFYATLPGVDLTVTKKGEQRYKGRVFFSQRARLGQDTLTFYEIFYWTELIFSRNDGMPLVYISVALGTLGALLIFVLPYKQLHIKVAEEGDGVKISMGGWSKRYKALFSEEFKEIAEKLEKGLRERRQR